MATREMLHQTVTAASDARLERASPVVLDEVDSETARESILAPDRERRLGAGNEAMELMDVRQPTAPPVADTVDSLILDLLEWMGPEPRPYAEVLHAWRTSCPRLPVWEDANDRGFIARHRAPGRGALVAVSAAGAEHLRTHRHPTPR